MKIYAHYGFKDFILGLGYKGELIKEYFINYDIFNSDFDSANDESILRYNRSNPDYIKQTVVSGVPLRNTISSHYTPSRTKGNNPDD